MSPNSIDAARAQLAAKRAQREGDSNFGPESNLMDLHPDEADTIFDPSLLKTTGLSGTVTKNINTVLVPGNHNSSHTHDKVSPIIENEPLLPELSFNRENLVPGTSKLTLLKKEWGEDLAFMNLVYKGESKNRGSNRMKLLKFSDGKNIFYWNGGQFNGNRITLQRYTEEYGRPKYPECDLDVRIHAIEY